MAGHYRTGNILVIGDTHIPFERPDYLDFCIKVRKEYKCDYVVHAGDVCDYHGLSYHEKELDAPTASDELILARKHLRDWKKAFRNMKICFGNHCNLITRKAKTHGIPSAFLKTMNQVLELPDTWEWNRTHILNNVQFMHGTGFSGKYPMATAMYYNRYNTVIGHIHSVGGTYFSASDKDMLWGMSVGCGTDDKQIVFNYGKENQRKSMIGCGVVLENGKLPIFKPMEL